MDAYEFLYLFYDILRLSHLILTLTATVVNVVLLVVFVRHPEIRTPENLMLINLCVADLVYLLSFQPTFYIRVLVYHKLECYVFTFCSFFALALDICSVAAISIQRYLGLKKFTNRLAADRKDYRQSLLTIAGVWMVATILAGCDVLLMYFRSNPDFCSEKWFSGECMYRVIMYGVVPTVVIVVLYIAVSHKVIQSAHQLPSEECAAAIALRQQRRKSSKILFALAWVFGLSFLPFTVTVFCLTDYIGWPALLADSIVLVLSVLNPLFNPIALILASKQLRQLYTQHCCCCCYCSGSNALQVARQQNPNATSRETQV